MEVKYLSGHAILTLHHLIMKQDDDLEQAGIKYPNKFDAMLNRPQTDYYGQEQFPSILAKACCYYHSIAKGHIFHNGNKRTGLGVFLLFLRSHGYDMHWDKKMAEDFTVYLAEDEKFKSNDAIELLMAELEPYLGLR